MSSTYITAEAQKLLGLLASFLPPKTYLAGGTGLALHLHHRLSYDLDYYTSKKFDVKITTQLWEEKLPHFRLVQQAWQTIMGAVGDTEISLFYYHYPLLDKLKKIDAVSVASIADLACMKLEAIASRGLKRDFFDLYTICQLENYSLEKIIQLSQQKYQRQSSNLPHLFKSLIYFTDADTKSERAKIVDQEWLQVKDFFLRSVPPLMKKLLS